MEGASLPDASPVRGCGREARRYPGVGGGRQFPDFTFGVGRPAPAHAQLVARSRQEGIRRRASLRLDPRRLDGAGGRPCATPLPYRGEFSAARAGCSLSGKFLLSRSSATACEGHAPASRVSRALTGGPDPVVGLFRQNPFTEFAEKRSVRGETFSQPAIAVG